MRIPCPPRDQEILWRSSQRPRTVWMDQTMIRILAELFIYKGISLGCLREAQLSKELFHRGVHIPIKRLVFFCSLREFSTYGGITMLEHANVKTVAIKNS